MLPILIILSLTAALLLWPLARRRWREHRRATIRARAFPRLWSELLRMHVPLYGRLPPRLRDQLHGHILVLLAEKDFHGAGGFAVTDTMRLVIAAQAALLLFDRRCEYYPLLCSIVVHPAAFVVDRERWDAAGLHHREHQVLSGESWETGQLVLSWDDSLAGGMACGDGYNVVLHEFAHQLDLESGEMDGTPPLDTAAARAAWHAAFAPAYADHCDRVDAGEETWLDPYAASAPEEFFAVLTEAFFELPADLSGEYPAVYACLRDYYRVDPRLWSASGAGPDMPAGDA